MTLSIGQRPHSVLLIIYRCSATAGLSHTQDWCESWLPDSVLSLVGVGVLLRPATLLLQTLRTASAASRMTTSAFYLLGCNCLEFIGRVKPTCMHIGRFCTQLPVSRTIQFLLLDKLLVPGWFRFVEVALYATVRVRCKLAVPSDGTMTLNCTSESWQLVELVSVTTA